MHDRAALHVYRLLVALRFYRFWVTPRLLWGRFDLAGGWRPYSRWAVILEAMDVGAARRAPLLKHRIQAFSIADPLSELVERSMRSGLRCWPPIRLG